MPLLVESNPIIHNFNCDQQTAAYKGEFEKDVLTTSTCILTEASYNHTW